MKPGDVLKYAEALTAPQKSTLDGVMANANVGQPPPTANTIFAYYDPLERQSQINAALSQWGISYQSYPGEIAGIPVVRMLFSKKLTSQDKTRLQTAIWNQCVVQEQA